MIDDTDHTEVWTRINDDGERVYIAVQIHDGRVTAATNAYETADDALTGMFLYGGQAAWVRDNADKFERRPR